MISPRMNRPAKVLLTLGAALAIAVATGACGTQWISVPKSNQPLYHGAVLFNQRCWGCHTLSYAGTHGSASSSGPRNTTTGRTSTYAASAP